MLPLIPRVMIAVAILVGSFDRLFALDDHPGWPIEIDEHSYPTVADLDGDGVLEVLIAADGIAHVFNEDGTYKDGWPWEPPDGYPTLTPRAGNVDDDEELEVVIEVFGRIYILEHDGTEKSTSPIERPHVTSEYYELTLTDLDGDGDLEILVIDTRSEADYIYAWHGDSEPVDGWPVDIRPEIDDSDPAHLSDCVDAYYTELACGDLDFDGKSEVIPGTYCRDGGSNNVGVPLLVLNGDGTVRDGWPWEFAPSDALTYPGIADLDGDYSCEIFGAADAVYCLRADASWYLAPQELRGGVPRPIAAADLDGDGRKELVAPKGKLAVFAAEPGASDATIAITGSAEEYHEFDGVSCGDVDGDGYQEILVWSYYYGNYSEYALHLFDMDLKELPGWPIVMESIPGVNLAGVPKTILADIDNDGDMEGLYTYDKLYCIAFEKTGDLDCKSDWPTTTHDATHAFYAHTFDKPDQVFVRGDANRDERVNIADGILILKYLYLGHETDCAAAFDFDADTDIGLLDAIALLNFLFATGDAPAAPYPDCGPKPAGDPYTCMQFECEK